MKRRNETKNHSVKHSAGTLKAEALGTYHQHVSQTEEPNLRKLCAGRVQRAMLQQHSVHMISLQPIFRGCSFQ